MKTRLHTSLLLALGAVLLSLTFNSCQDPGSETPPPVPTSLDIEFDNAIYDFPQGYVGTVGFTLSGLSGSDVAEVSFKYDETKLTLSNPRSVGGSDSDISLKKASDGIFGVECKNGKFALSIEMIDTTGKNQITVSLKYRYSVQKTVTFSVRGRSSGGFSMEQKTIAAGFRDFVNFELRDFPASAPGVSFDVRMRAKILKGRGVIQYTSSKFLWNDTLSTSIFQESHNINNSVDMIMFTGFMEGYNVIEFTFSSYDNRYVRTYVDSILVTPATFSTKFELDRYSFTDPDASIITTYDKKLEFDLAITDSYINFNRYSIALVDLDYKQISDDRVTMRVGDKSYNTAQDVKQFNDLEHYSFDNLFPHYYTTTSNAQINYAERTNRIIIEGYLGKNFEVGTYNLRLLVKEQYASSWQVIDCSFTVLAPPVRGALDVSMVSGGSFYPATGTIDLTNAQLPTKDLSSYELTVTSSHPKVLVYATDPAQRKSEVTIDNIKVSNNSFGVMVATEEKFEVTIKLTGKQGDALIRTLTEKELHNNKPSSSLMLGDGHGWCAMNYDFSVTLNYLPNKGFDGKPFSESVYTNYFNKGATLQWKKVTLLDNIGTLYVNGKELREGDKIALGNTTNSFAFNTAEPRRNYDGSFPSIERATYMLEGDHTIKLIFTLADGRILERLVTITMVAENIPVQLIIKDANGYTSNKVQWAQGNQANINIPSGWKGGIGNSRESNTEILQGSGTFQYENGGRVYIPDPTVKGIHIVDFFFTVPAPFQRSSKTHRLTLEVK